MTTTTRSGRWDATSMPPPWPRPGAVDVCVDTPLVVAVAEPTSPQDLGPVRIRRSDGVVVDTLDAGDPASCLRTVGGAVSDTGELHWFRYHPVLERPGSGGRVLEIYPHAPLEHARTYRLELDGAVGPWFTTRAAPPAGRQVLRVAQDGSGDFCTVQGAVDAVPAGNRRPVRIEVAAGTYREILYISADRPHLTIQGAGRGRTVLSYDNNNQLNGLPSPSHCPNRRLGDRDLHNGWRANVGVEADDVTLVDLSCVNTTPAGGSQAEALRGNGTRTVLNRVALHGHQDTLRLQGTGFVVDTLVEGDVDFVWGTGAVHHWRSEYRSLGPGYLMQIRNGADERGHVLVDCRLTRAAGVPDHSVRVARTDPRAFPHSEAVLLGCRLDDHVHPDRWLVHPPADAPGRERFLEHDCTDALGRPTRRDRPLAAAEAARWRDPAHTLGGWVPWTVNVGSSSGVAGGAAAVHWSAPPGHLAGDRLVLCEAEDGSGTAPLRAEELGSTATTGTTRFPLPRRAGRYRLGLRPAGTTHPVCWSEEVEVTP